MSNGKPATGKVEPPLPRFDASFDPAEAGPLSWWRTRSPRDLGQSDLDRLMAALEAAVGSGALVSPAALLVEPAFCIARVLACLQSGMPTPPRFDAAMSALLVGALRGDPACAVTMAHVLGRLGRARTDLALTLLAGLWRPPGPLLSGPARLPATTAEG